MKPNLKELRYRVLVLLATFVVSAVLLCSFGAIASYAQGLSSTQDKHCKAFHAQQGRDKARACVEFVNIGNGQYKARVTIHRNNEVPIMTARAEIWDVTEQPPVNLTQGKTKETTYKRLTATSPRWYTADPPLAHKCQAYGVVHIEMHDGTVIDETIKSGKRYDCEPGGG